MCFYSLTIRVLPSVQKHVLLSIRSSYIAVVDVICLSQKAQVIPSHDFWVVNEGATSATARVKRQSVILPAGCSIDVKPC